MPTPWSWQCGPPPFASSAPSLTPSPTVWHRRLWAPEAVLAAGRILTPGYADLLISCHVALPPSSQSSELFSQVKAATRSLRWAHPGICSLLECPVLSDTGPDVMNACFLYNVPRGEGDVNDWLVQVVHDRSQLLNKTGGDLAKAVAMLRLELGSVSAPKSAYMFDVHYIGQPATQTFAVLVQVAHALFDGIGTFEVLDLWLRELGTHLARAKEEDLPFKWGEEAARLAKPVPDRAKTPWTEGKEDVDLYMVEKVREALSLPPPVFGLPILDISAAPTYAGHILEVFPAPMAEHLRKSARAQDCSVFTAFLAATYTSFLRLNPPAHPSENIQAALVPCASNLRSAHLAGGSATDRSKWQVGLALGSYAFIASDLGRFLPSVSKDEVTDVWTLAHEIQAQLDDQRKYQDTASQWMTDGVMMVVKFFFGQSSEPSENRHVDVISLGVVDNSLAKSFPIGTTDQSFTISHPIFSYVRFLLPATGPSFIAHHYTWDGVLHLSIGFPVANLGSAEEQERARGEGKVTLSAFVEHYVSLLEKLASDEDGR